MCAFCVMLTVHNQCFPPNINRQAFWFIIEVLSVYCEVSNMWSIDTWLEFWPGRTISWLGFRGFPQLSVVISGILASLGQYRLLLNGSNSSLNFSFGPVQSQLLIASLKAAKIDYFQVSSLDNCFPMADRWCWCLSLSYYIPTDNGGSGLNKRNA
jgi:hypothetical protein